MRLRYLVLIKLFFFEETQLRANDKAETQILIHYHEEREKQRDRQTDRQTEHTSKESPGA